MKKLGDFINHYFFILVPAALLVFYVYATDTLIKDNQALHTQLNSEGQQLDWMQQQALTVTQQTGNPGGKILSPVEALAHIEQLARRHQILPQVKNLRPVNNNTVRLWMKSVDFHRFIAMLDELLSNNSLSVNKLNITAISQPGRADADLTLSLTH